MSPTPQNSDDEDIMYADEDEDLTAFINTPFIVHQDSDEAEAPMTKGQFKDLSAKLDSLLRSTQSHKTTVDGLISENNKVLQKTLATVEASEKLILELTAKVGKLQDEVSSFMKTFRSSHEADVESMNKVISSFQDSLKEKKVALSTLRTELRSENTELSTAINVRVEKLQKDLAMENIVMDSLALQTQKAKVKSAQLAQALETISELTNQSAVISSSCVSDVNSLLRKTVETNDSVLTPSIRHHLTIKLHPAFCLLNQIIGVSGSGPSPKQGGETEETKPEIQTGEASVPKKRKRKIGEEDDDSEDDTLNDEKLKRQKRNKELDEFKETNYRKKKIKCSIFFGVIAICVNC